MLFPVYAEQFGFNFEKIGITVAHGTGKTTLISDYDNALRDGSIELPQNVLAVKTIGEQATRLRELIGDPDLMTAHNAYNVQQHLMAMQVSAEVKALMETVADHKQVGSDIEPARSVGKVILLTDRTNLDQVSYSKVLFKERWEANKNNRVMERSLPMLIRMTKAVAILPVGEIPLEGGDGLREVDEDFQKAIDLQLRSDYAALGIPLTEISGSRSQRLEQLVKLIGEVASPDYKPYPSYRHFANHSL